MRKELVNSLVNNIQTYFLWKDECEMVASNVLQIKYKDKTKKLIIDRDNINNTLLYNGSIAWFKDEYLGDGLIAMPYTSVGGLDVNGKPTVIDVTGYGGIFSYKRRLHKGEFVIMYDNTKRISILRYVRQYAERLAQMTRTIDINVNQQRTPRIWKTTPEKLATTRELLSNVNENVENILAFEELEFDNFECLVAPAPFVADQISEQKDKLWNEFLRFVGVTNLTVQKKERNIRDEIQASQGGTFVSRFSRFETRLDAIEEIKEVFGDELVIEYYDGEPTTEDKKEDDENEVISDVTNLSGE